MIRTAERRGAVKKNWYDFLNADRLLLLIIIVTGIVLIVGLDEAERKSHVQTLQTAPLSWQVKENRSNLGWLILGPAGIPFAFGGGGERCYAEVKIEGKEMFVRTARDLCETRPSMLEITYKTWEYNSDIQIMEVGVLKDS